MATRKFKVTFTVELTLSEEYYEPGATDEEIIAIETENFLTYPEELAQLGDGMKVTMERIS